MNKNYNLYPLERIKCFRSHFVSMMRISLLLITVGLTSSFANPSTALTRININVKNVSLKELFKDIQNKSEFIFFYQDDIVKYHISLQ